MRNKITSAAEAVSLIQNGDTVCTSGFVGVGTPNELLLALEKRFVETAAPRGITLLVPRLSFSRQYERIESIAPLPLSF